MSIDVERGAGEAADEQRHAHAGAADDGELHEALRRRVAAGGSADAAGSTVSDVRVCGRPGDRELRAAFGRSKAGSAAARGRASMPPASRVEAAPTVLPVAGTRPEQRRAARRQEPGVEGVAGAGRVHRRDPRRRHHHVAVGAGAQPRLPSDPSLITVHLRGAQRG